MKNFLTALFFKEPFAFLTTDVLTSRISWTIRLRWLAVAGYLLGTVAARQFSSFVLPYEKMWMVLGCLAIINLIYTFSEKWLKRLTFSGEIVVLQIQIVIDLFILTVLLHYAGGIGNPIYLFYVFHVVLSSIIFTGFIPVIYASLTVLSFITLIFLEYNGYIGHYCLFRVCNHENLDYIYLVILIFSITVFVTAYICMAFMRTYRNIKQQIDQKHRELIESDKQKTKFFRFASHELKSPIIAIKSSLDSFLRNYSGEVDERAVNLIRRANFRAAQMLEMTQELLELSRNRALIRKRKLERVNLAQLLKEIIEQESTTAKEKKQKISADISDAIPLIPAEKNDMLKIFGNLINNAVRYTPERGSIKIYAGVENAYLLFKISDTGIGISEDEMDKVFGEFYRSENAKKMVNFGTGLGLSLVKQLVDSYKGTIEIYSQLDKGTTFIIRIPIEQSEGDRD